MSKEIATRMTGVAVGAPQHDLGQVMELARIMAVSSLLPQELRGKPSDVLVAILYGQELGLAPMQAIQSIYVVKGRPTISAQLWVSLARRAGHKVRVLDEQPDLCTVEVERGDDPTEKARVTYTLDMAKTAGLMSNANWKNHPHAMLYARAVSTACRRACPEIALGFGDETDREPPAAKPTLAQVAAEREDKPAEKTPEPEIVVDPEPTTEELAELAAIAERHTAAADDDDPTLPNDPDLFAADGER